MYKIIGADGREYGPVNLTQLREWLAEGRVNAETRALVQGAAEWKALGELPEFASRPDRPAAPEVIRPVAGATAPMRYPKMNGLAVTGLILGIFSFVLSFCCCGGLPWNLLGLLCSGIGLGQINRQPEIYTGKDAAVAGLIISGLSLLLGLGIMLMSVAFNWHEILREMHKL